MAATIQIHEMSALDSGTDKTSGTVRFKDADNSTVDSSNPLVVPAADSIYSYTKKLRPYMEAPPNTNISNLRWYSDGGNGFGLCVGIRTGETVSGPESESPRKISVLPGARTIKRKCPAGPTFSVTRQDHRSTATGQIPGLLCRAMTIHISAT